MTATEPAARTRVPPLALVAWTAGSFLGTICGVGGGIFAVPLLHYAVKLPMKVAVGTSLVIVLAMTTSATVAEALHGRSSIDWAVVGLLLFGSVPGAHVGYAFGKRADVRTLKLAFVALLVLAAVRTATLDSDTVARSNGGAIPLDLAHVAWVSAIGFGGGFLAPLLGVGGGILVIPALFLSLPSMGYLDARACSMAMSVVNAAQSVLLHLRDRTIETRIAAPFAVLAVLTALAGTWAVHLEGWADIARLCMTAVLIAVAARFAWDVWVVRRAKPEGISGA